MKAIVILSEDNEVNWLLDGCLNVVFFVSFLFLFFFWLFSYLIGLPFIGQKWDWKSFTKTQMIFFSFQDIQWVPKRGCSCICAPYTLTSGDTGSSISAVTQDTLLIQTDVSLFDFVFLCSLHTALKLLHCFDKTWIIRHITCYWHLQDPSLYVFIHSFVNQFNFAVI